MFKYTICLPTGHGAVSVPWDRALGLLVPVGSGLAGRGVAFADSCVPSLCPVPCEAGGENADLDRCLSCLDSQSSGRDKHGSKWW